MEPAKTFPAPEFAAEVPVGPAIGLPVPELEDDTKDAEADAVTLVGFCVLDVFKDAGTVMFLLGWRTVMVCGMPLPLGMGMGAWVVAMITEEVETPMEETMAEVVVVLARMGIEAVVVAALEVVVVCSGEEVGTWTWPSVASVALVAAVYVVGARDEDGGWITSLEMPNWFENWY